MTIDNLQLTITGENAGINLAPASVKEEVLQNLKMLLLTTKGSVPLDRNFGLSARFLSAPTPAAEALFIAEVYEAVEKYEPRAEIINITFERDEINGRVFPRLEVRING